MFDLFKLYDENDDNTVHKWIVVSGKQLSQEVRELLEVLYSKFKRKDIDKILEKKLKISNITAQRLRRVNKKWYPIIFLKTIIEIYGKALAYSKNKKSNLKKSLIFKIELIKVNHAISRPVKAVKELTIDLCKIAGAHAADGTLHNSLIRISDENKESVESFKGWVETSFEIDLPEVKPVKGSKEWGLSFQIKVISRYFRKFFDFPSRSKTYSVKEPEIIKKSDIEFRKAFALGVLTFDGGVGIKPQVEFCVSSKNLRDSIAEILELSGMKIKIPQKKSGKYWRFWTAKLEREEATKWLQFFEHNTEKWFKLYEISNGFQGNVNSSIEALDVFNHIYSQKSSSKITLNEVLKIILEQKEVYRYQLAELLCKNNGLNTFGGKWAHGVSHYLSILKNANIVTIEKRAFGKKKRGGEIIREIYKLNPDTMSWRVPFRPWFDGIINDVK